MLVPFEFAQGKNRKTHFFQSLSATDIGQINQKRAFNDVATHFLYQRHSGFGCAAGGEQIINDQYTLARGNGVIMNFNAVGAIFQRIVMAGRFTWQLARFAHRNKADTQRISEWCCKHEATRFDANDFIDRLITITRNQTVNTGFEAGRIFQQGRDVTKLNTRLGIVRNGTDELGEVHGLFG